MRLRRWLPLLPFVVSGCWFSPDEHVQACSSDADCAAGSSCYANLCVPRDSTAIPEDACPASSRIESCYDGPPETEGVGICHAGQRVCVDGIYTECLGQALPQAEVCNAKDDDCNGTADDVATTSSCDTRLLGACAEGSLLCRAGVEFCQPIRQSQPESCNAVDDDCDGAVDEIEASPCYPEGEPGCEMDAQGSWVCQGRCTAGVMACSGAEQTCSGATTPVAETCTTGQDVAQDENCDGEIDEGCSCEAGSTRDCYAGPAGTAGLGVCRAGTQTCVDSEWQPCVGQVVPRAETCENPGSDDDCNGIVDDVPGAGTPCVASGESGVCRDGTLTCVAGEPRPRCVGGSPQPERCDEIDQDCDGDPTNGFDLTSDATCGACDVQCSSATEVCCGATCIDRASLERDVQNCGECGNACGAGQYCCQGKCLNKATMMIACDCPSSCGALSCCGTSCRDLRTDKNNCGACGLHCGPGKDCIGGECRMKP